jgi:hypothetical protein
MESLPWFDKVDENASPNWGDPKMWWEGRVPEMEKCALKFLALSAELT